MINTHQKGKYTELSLQQTMVIATQTLTLLCKF